MAAASDLIDPGAVASRESGSRFQLTIWVDDADAACAELETRGVTLLNGPTDRAWGQRTASFIDPAGHIWEVAQELSRLKANKGIRSPDWAEQCSSPFPRTPEHS